MSVAADDDKENELASSSPPPTSSFHMYRRPHFFHMRKTTVDPTAKPLRHATKREGSIIPLQPSATTGSGQGYRKHVPLTLSLRMNDTTTFPLSSLLDTGAALSIIDEHLLQTLGGEAQGDGMWVHGIGNIRTKGWVSLTIFIESTDAQGRTVHLESQQDFHVLPLFSPGLCLGLDFITAHDVRLAPARQTAAIAEYVFPVREHIAGPHTAEAALHTAVDTEIPTGRYVWVPVDAACLAPGVDYTVHPRLSVDEDQGTQLAGPTALIQHSSRAHVWWETTARCPVCSSPEVFAIGVPETDSDVDAVPVTMDADAATPLNSFEGTDDGTSNLTCQAVTTMVDDQFRVGVTDDGGAPQEIVDVLRAHRDAFALDGRPGRVVGQEMPIDLKPDADVRPVPPRRASPEKRRAMDAAIDQLLDWDIIEPSSSPVSFPVLMVKQYDKWRFCVDYRNLNVATVSDRYPLPTIDSIFNTLLGKRIFSSLDAIRGYHQMPVREGDRWKTAFTCHRGLYQYKTVPFGLKNAPAVFQRLMDRILGGLRWRHAVVYIDDVVIASHSMSEHADALDTLLRNAKSSGLRFSPGKCTFAVPSLVLLGRKVSGAGVAVWEDRAKAVRDLPRPSTLRELYHTLGLFGYYRAFVRRFAELAAPLSKLTRGWRYEAAVDGRYRLVNTAGQPASADKVLVPWAEEQQGSFDALKAAIASPPTLAHPDPSRPYVLYVDACKDAFAAILHQVFPVNASPPVPSADAARVFPAFVHLLPPQVAKERWIAWVRMDRYFAGIYRRVSDAGSADDEDWTLTDGLLVRRIDGKLALPESALSEVLRLVHDQRGHFGFLRTYLAVSRDFWRPQLSVAVRAWVRHCPVCVRTKRVPKVGQLDVDHDPQFPFSTISLDILYGLPRTRSGNDAVVAIHDVFSKMIILQPCSATITAEGVAAVVSDRVLRYGWRPRRIVTDSETRVSGAVMRELARSLRAELTPSPPHHQQANAVERAIQTAQMVLQTLSAEGRAHWDRRLVPTVELAMNSTPSSVTGFRPFDLIFVCHPDVCHAVFDGDDHLGVSSFSERLVAAEARLEEARLAIGRARAEQKRRYDRRRATPAVLAIGDQVFVRLDDRPIPGLRVDKLDPRKAGPYRVEEVLSPHRVRIGLPADVGVSNEFSLEQLDLVPREPDPFDTRRVASPVPAVAGAEEAVEDADGDGVVAVDADRFLAADGEPLLDDLSDRPVRHRQLPPNLRGFELGTVQPLRSSALTEALRGPIFSSRTVEEDGVSIELRERPVAFLSRLTSVSEKKMVASELELCCLAWAFARFAHLLEGAEVTIVTDHAPLGPMLLSTAEIPYGPTISRCRAWIMPHLPNLRFVHRPGHRHTNADALSRLPLPSS